MEALTPPHGDQNRVRAMLLIFWAQFLISTIFLILRLVARKVIKRLGSDDLCISIAWILYTITLIVSSIYVKEGGTRHVYYLNSHQVSTAIRLNWIAAPFGLMALAAAKTSVALFSLKLLGPMAVWRKRFLRFNIWLINVITLLTCILSIVQCSPPRAHWEKVTGAKCWNPMLIANIFMFLSAYNTFLDFALALLPISVVWNLQLSQRKKVGLYGILGVGLFACIISGIKTSTLNELRTRIDFTWVTFDLFAWTSSESFLIFICACLPAMKPLYDRLNVSRHCASVYAWGKNLSCVGYLSKRSDQINYDSTSVCLDTSGARSTMGNRTNTRGQGPIADSSIPLNDISVEHAVNIESPTSHHFREEREGTDHLSLV